MSAPVEVTVACPNEASHGPQCQQMGIPKDRRCGRCGGDYGEPGRGVTATLVGRDALVMAWARLQLRTWHLAGIRNATTEQYLEFGRVAEENAAALSALRAWDAATEGGGSDG